MEDDQQGPGGARPQRRTSPSSTSTISSQHQIRNCQTSDLGENSSTSNAVESKDIARDHAFNYRPTVMKWPFLVSLMFALMATLVLNIVALRVLPPDDRDGPDLTRRDLPSMNNSEPKEDPRNVLLQPATNIERESVGYDECGTATVTVIGGGDYQSTTMTSFTTVFLTRWLRRGVNTSSSRVIPTLNTTLRCVPTTEWNTLPETKGGPYMTIGTRTVVRTMYRPVDIPDQTEETDGDGPKIPSDTAAGTKDLGLTPGSDSPTGSQGDNVPQNTEPAGVTIMPNPPQDTTITKSNPAPQKSPSGDVPRTTRPVGVDTAKEHPPMISGTGSNDIHDTVITRASPGTEDTFPAPLPTAVGTWKGPLISIETPVVTNAGFTVTLDSTDPSIVPQPPPLGVLTRSSLIMTDSDGRPVTTQIFEILAGSTDENASGKMKPGPKAPNGIAAESPSFARVVLLDASGQPTATTTIEMPPNSPGGGFVGQTASEPETPTELATQRISHARVVLADTDGRPTATRTIDVLVVSAVGTASGETGPHNEALYGPMVSQTLSTSRVVMTDSNGQPTATSSVEMLIVSPIGISPSKTEKDPEVPNGAVTETLVDAKGVPYSTRVVITTAPPTPWATTLSRSGVPWTTITANSSGPTYIPYVYETAYTMTRWQYFIGMFLPTLITTAASIPIRMLERNMMLLHPFHTLASAKGSLGSESMLGNAGSFGQKMTAILHPSRDNMLLVLGTTLVLVSTVVTALSGEAVGISLHGCEKNSQDLTNCAMSLSVFPATAKITLALLVILVLVLLFIILLLRRWQSGVPTNPWSLGSMVILSSHAGTKSVILEVPAASEKAKSAVLGKRVFRLHQARIEAIQPETNSPPCEETPLHSQSTFVETNSCCHSPGHFTMLTLWARLLFFSFLGGILSMVAYYQSDSWENGFEDFMASYSFGVRLLFTSIGIAINLFWGSFFLGVSTLSPFQLLASSPQEARHSILLAPPTDPFSGLWTGIRRRHGFLAVTAFTACLAELLPVLLGNVPSNASQTLNTHINSTWAAIAVLAFMVLVLLGSFAVRWPSMPADPTSIVGMMHYVVDSPALLDNLDGLGALEKRERDRRVQERGLRYGFGPMKGVSGETRIGVYVMDRKVASGEQAQAWHLLPGTESRG